MQTSKYIATVTWIILSLFVIIGFKEFGWLPKRLTVNGVYIDPSIPLSPVLPSDSPKDPWGSPTGTATPSAAQPEPNLIGHWNFNQTPGSVVFDTSGNSFNGSGSGDWLASADCIEGYCVRLRSSNRARIELNLPALPTYTWSGWVKPSTISEGEYQIFWTNNDNFGLSLIGNKVQMFDKDSLLGSTVLQPDRFYHIAVTSNGRWKTIYLDGNLESRTQAYSRMSAGPAIIGAVEGDRYLNATIDDVRLYDRALTQREIIGLYGAFRTAPAYDEATDPFFKDNDPLPTSTVIPPLSKGDLTVDYISFEAESEYYLKTSHYIYFNALVRNSGEGDLFIPEGTQFNVMCDSSNCDYSNPLFAGLTSSAFTLRPGEARSLDLISLDIQNMNLRPGNYGLLFIADPTQKVAENHYSDNIARINITLH